MCTAIYIVEPLVLDAYEVRTSRLIQTLSVVLVTHSSAQISPQMGTPL